MGRKSRQFAKDSRELEWAHPHASRQRQQAMLIGESLDELLARRLDSFRVPRQLRVGKTRRSFPRRRQVRGDDQIHHPLVRRQLQTFFRHSPPSPSQKSEIVSESEKRFQSREANLGQLFLHAVDERLMEPHGKDGIGGHPAKVAVLVNSSALGQKGASLLDQPLPFFEAENEWMFLEKVDSSEGADRLAGREVESFRAVLQQKNVCELRSGEGNLHKGQVSIRR